MKHKLYAYVVTLDKGDRIQNLVGYRTAKDEDSLKGKVFADASKEYKKPIADITVCEISDDVFVCECEMDYDQEEHF